VLAPLGWLSPVAGLAVVSLVVTTVVLIAVKALSSPADVAAAKRRMHAALLEMRLFKNDEPAMLRAALEVVRSNAVYLMTLALPLAVTTVPLMVLLAHLDSFYGFTGVTPGAAAVVTVHLRSAGASGREQTVVPPASLDTSNAVCVETPAIWFPATHDFVWRVRPHSAGRFAMRIQVGANTYAKTLYASDSIARLAASRIPARWSDGLFDPFDAILPFAGDVESIDVTYPPRGITLFGYRLHWLVLLSGFSLAFAIVLKKPLGVSL
jgi:hypothetical protein